jgi:hypothetical protein
LLLPAVPASGYQRVQLLKKADPALKDVEPNKLKRIWLSIFSPAVI